jgi:hypothetical protein
MALVNAIMLTVSPEHLDTAGRAGVPYNAPTGGLPDVVITGEGEGQGYLSAQAVASRSSPGRW